jgi:hypothetical protein
MPGNFYSKKIDYPGGIVYVNKETAVKFYFLKGCLNEYCKNKTSKWLQPGNFINVLFRLKTVHF